MERTPKLKLSSVYGTCAMKAFERRTDMDIANGMDITLKVAPMIKALFKVKTRDTEPGFVSPDSCNWDSEMLSELLDITVTPFEYASLWNQEVREWEENQLKDMCPVATVRLYSDEINERITVAWDDFGDLHLHTAWGIIAPSETFGGPIDDENLKAIRKAIEGIYKDYEFTVHAYNMRILAEAMVIDGETGTKEEIQRMQECFHLDDDATTYLRRQIVGALSRLKKDDPSDDLGE